MASQPHSARFNANATNEVRRNLFRSQLSRRPTNTSASTKASSLVDSSRYGSSSEIVVRNQNGNYIESVPSLPIAENDASADNESQEAEELRVNEMLGNRPRQSSEEELLKAVRSSLCRTTAALEEEMWFFEVGQKMMKPPQYFTYPRLRDSSLLV